MNQHTAETEQRYESFQVNEAFDGVCLSRVSACLHVISLDCKSLMKPKMDKKKITLGVIFRVAVMVVFIFLFFFFAQLEINIALN